MNSMNKYTLLLLLSAPIAVSANYCDDLYKKYSNSWMRDMPKQVCEDAVNGDAEAQFSVASWNTRYLRQPEETYRWIKMSAEQGCAKSQYVLGLHYYEGKVVDTDWFKAFAWIKKAADNGIPDAQAMLGFMYQHGHAIGQNYTIALELYHKAAAQHNEDAYLYLGRMYENGMGVTKDYAKAYEYFVKAKIAHVLSYLPDYPCDIYKNPD